MNINNYKWRRGVILLVATLSSSYCSKAKPPEPIALEREQEEISQVEKQEKIIFEESKKDLESLTINLSPNLSKEELKEKIVDLTVYRAKREVEDILNQIEFKFYDPLSEIDKLREKLLDSYNEMNSIKRVFAHFVPKKSVELRNEFNDIQNKVLNQLYQDIAAGTINQLTETTLGTCYIKTVGYKKLMGINKDFYNLIIESLNKMDKAGIEQKIIEEKKILTELLFESEREYLDKLHQIYTN